MARRIDEIEELKGDFSISISRDYEDSAEGRLLRIAESIYPLIRGSYVIPDINKPLYGRTAQWWISDLDGIRIPLSITSGAVAYYADLIRSFERGDFTGTHGIVQTRASLEYSGSVEAASMALQARPRRVEGIFVVQMELSWSSSCGDLCGLSFRRRRIVVLDEGGSVLELIEDPLPPIEVN